MINFLKSFFANEKSPEEQGLLTTQQKERDILTLDNYDMGEEEEQPQEGCAPSGCGRCGCG